MSQPYVGEIRLFPYTRGAPLEWQLCDGTLLSIAQYETLYTLLGTTYGGDGITSFAVPDLRGRVPIHEGTGLGLSTYVLGEVGGTENVTLLTPQMPQHNHFVMAGTQAAGSSSPTGNVPAAAYPNDGMYTPSTTGATAATLIPTTIGQTGGTQPHDNCAPTLTLNYCIALYGIFPSQG